MMIMINKAEEVPNKKTLVECYESVNVQFNLKAVYLPFLLYQKAIG